MTRRIAVVVLILLSAAFALADEHSAVLTGGGEVYTADTSGAVLRIVKRVGEDRTTLVVPKTDDEAVESDVKLVWDEASNSLFVVWHRSGHRIDQILLTQLRADGTWSDNVLVASGASAVRLGLEVVMTHAPMEAGTATLVHAAWWHMSTESSAEYALVAFENGRYTSLVTSDLKSLAGVNHADTIELEAMNEVAHPPLAMARSGESAVDVVFGDLDSTRLTRLVVDPKLRVDARLWKPSRKTGGTTPRAGIQSLSGAPLGAMIANGRIVLYAPEVKFRYTIYDNVEWSPERMIQLDENLTSDQLVQELRRTIEQLVTDEDGEGDGDVVQ